VFFRWGTEVLRGTVHELPPGGANVYIDGHPEKPYFYDNTREKSQIFITRNAAAANLT
jgi:hypothetical protein